MNQDTRYAPLFASLERPLPTSPKVLTFRRCEPGLARQCNRLWHSRLPLTQVGPWQYAFAAESEGWVFAVALWNSPSARMLPGHWLELRRLACAPDAPRCTASWMLGQMRRWFQANASEHERLISYQDEAVHKGTIYRAAGWQPAFRSVPRVRDRSGLRAGTHRSYRSNLNGVEPDAAPKVRWEMVL